MALSDTGVVNREKLRFDDEFVRHKMLDCIGDLYLAGAPLIGTVTASRSGHRHNNRLLHALFAADDAFRYVDLAELGGGAAWSAKPLPFAAGRLGLGAAD